VVDIIREAAKSPETLKTVVKVVKATNPNSISEIDELVKSLKKTAAAERQEKLARAGYFEGWSGSGNIGISKTTGNDNDTAFVVGVDLVKDGLKFHHKFKAKMDHETSSGAVTHNNYLVGYELDYKFSPRLYSYGLGIWDRDTFEGFARRFTESVGLGYFIAKTDALKFAVSAGPSLRQTLYTTGPSRFTVTGRVGADIRWKIREGMTLSEDFGVYLNSTFNSTTALTSALNNKVSARLSFDISHESDVLPGRNPMDTATRFSLVFGF
jgi:putative salt-induced outer membrane protein